MEDSMSSTNHKNKAQISGDELELSSEDSGWSSYLDNSVSSSNMEDTVTNCSSESSSIFTGAAASVKKMSANDDHVASARSAAKRRKMRSATFIDEDLEDTATSPVCNSEVKDLDQILMNLQDTSCSSNTLPKWQHGNRDYGSLIQEIQNSFHQTRELPHSGYIMKDINYTGLKEKGLCLVPVSLLFSIR